MSAGAVTDPLAELTEAELARLLRAAEPILAGRLLLHTGPMPSRTHTGPGIEFLDHQEYVVGDDVRSIDWRASLRRPTPQIRRRRDERSADWFVCVDCSASMGLFEQRKWRLAIQLGACLAYALLGLGHRVGLLLFTDRVERMHPPGRGRFQYARIARILRGAQAGTAGGGSDPGCCAARIAGHHPIVVISDFLAEDAMRAGLTRLLASGRTLHAMQVLDPDEVAVSGDGEILSLQDIESGRQLTVSSDANTAMLATAALTGLQSDLAAYCRARRVRYTACATDRGWKSAIRRHLLQLRAGND